jgi:hypothetical protein
VRLDHLLSKERFSPSLIFGFPVCVGCVGGGGVCPLRRRVFCGWVARWLWSAGYSVRLVVAVCEYGLAPLGWGWWVSGSGWLGFGRVGHAVGVLRKRALVVLLCPCCGVWGCGVGFLGGGRLCLCLLFGWVWVWCGVFFENCTVDASILSLSVCICVFKLCWAHGGCLGIRSR